ncbi:MAG: hypothetical protein SOY06_07485 [Prevotella sp.]|nr:hypothetical protein [Bacteroidales bacterium]MDY4229671.1 hypothetical protein [Prevotella sp.]
MLQPLFSEDAEPPKGRGHKINDMLQRDYIMRLIQEFLAALQRMLEKKEIESRRETLEKLYDQYVGPHDFYHLASVEDVFQSLAGEEAPRRAMKIQMLAELYYYDAQMETEPLRSMLLQKAYTMYDWLQDHEQTYSVERVRRLEEIRAAMNK